MKGLGGNALNLLTSRSWSDSMFGSLKTSIVATLRVWDGSATGPARHREPGRQHQTRGLLLGSVLGRGCPGRALEAAG